ncbi:MAG: DUF5009 domain-containing protein [Planctomycetota bacterium]|nr:MAG: DUF5009 domain-containing protein [Planctomycetota bacterium]
MSQTVHEEQPADHRRTSRSTRLVSLDAFRGFIMLTLAAKGFGFARTAGNLGHWPEPAAQGIAAKIWYALAFHTTHPPWNSQFHLIGCSYWDLVQPAFMFMVGVAMPYSYAGRHARGDSPLKITLHAAWRSIVLVLLGVFLQTRNGDGRNRLLTNVLSQIGLAYFPVFLLLGCSFHIQFIAAVVVLVGYWTLMVCWPVPTSLSQAAIQSLHDVSLAAGGLAPHFAKHANVAAAFDFWLLGERNPGGYATLNFIPSAVTILLGMMAGRLLREPKTDGEKLRHLLSGAVICMTLAVAASFTVCPVIKRIWTPAFTLYSGAWVLAMLALFYWLVDVRGSKWWTFPLIVLGTNPLAIYLMSMLLSHWIAQQLTVYLGDQWFTGPYGPTVEALAVLTVLWLAGWYMYRHRIFIRV